MNKPYYLTEKELKPSGVYIRSGTAPRLSTKEIIKKLIMESNNHSLESEISVIQTLTFIEVENYSLKSTKRARYYLK